MSHPERHEELRLAIREACAEFPDAYWRGLEALGEWMGFPAYFAGYGGKEPQRSGASHAAIAPYRPFECGDGEVVFLGIQN